MLFATLKGGGLGFQAGGGTRDAIGVEPVDVGAGNEELPRAAPPGELVASLGNNGIAGRDRGRGVPASTGPGTGDNVLTHITRYATIMAFRE